MTDINQRLRCRTCSEVSEDQEYHLLSEYFPEYDKKLSELLLFICRIDEQRESNCCPTEMCNNCTNRLKDAYNFAVQAQNVNKEILTFKSRSHSNYLDTISVKEEYFEFSEDQVSEQIVATDLNEFKVEIPFSYDSLIKTSMNLSEQKLNRIQTKKTDLTDCDFANLDPLTIKSHSINNFQEELSKENKTESKKIIKTKCQQNEDENEIRNKNECVKNKQININFETLNSQRKLLQSKQILCNLCNKIFERGINFNQHILNHRCGKESYKCLWCMRKFSFQNNLNIHIRRIHGIKKNSYETAKSIIRSTTSANGLKEIECKLCNLNFSTISALKSHLLESHLSTAGSLRCYSIMNSLGFELNINDSETEAIDTNDDGDTFEDDNSKHKFIYKCEICNLICKRKYHLAKHQLIMHKPEILPLKCDKCIFKTVSQDILEHHRQTQCYNEEKKFKCTKCSFKFMWKENLKTHQYIIHNSNTEEDLMTWNVQILNCVKCYQNFKDLISLKEHVKKEHFNKNRKAFESRKETVHSKKFNCNVCNRTFQRGVTFNQHMLTHRSDEELHKCLLCIHKFSHINLLYSHMKRVHGIEERSFESVKCVIRSTTSANGPKVIECKLCNSNFSTISALRSHLLESHHSTADSIKYYSIMNSLGFELHVDDSDTDTIDAYDDNLREKKQYKCEICNIIYKRRFELSKHQYAMHKPEILPLKCDKCIFKTVSHDILQHHKKMQCYNEEKKFNCDKCSFKFMWEYNLKIHQNLLHGTVKSTEISSIYRDNLFECYICWNKYESSKVLQDHLIEKHPVKYKKIPKKQLCSICGKSFGDLKTHMRRHTGDKPFKCDFCNKAFPHPTELKIHLTVHMTDMLHKCTVCEKGFSLPSHLKRHMRTHTGERPYKCSYCDKTFANSSALTGHIRIHTGERPYVCRDCGRPYISASLLKKHCKKTKHHYEVKSKL